jgi:hypothetical protein
VEAYAEGITDSLRMCVGRANKKCEEEQPPRKGSWLGNEPMC